MINSKGAALRLGCSLTWILKLVKRGKLRAFAYNAEGRLELCIIGQKRQGQGLYFFEEDLLAYHPANHGRPMGSPDKVVRNPNRQQKKGQKNEQKWEQANAK